MSTTKFAPQPRLQRRGLKGLLLLSLLLSPLSAHAALKSWSAAVDGSWDDPAKWSPAGVPPPPTACASRRRAPTRLPCRAV